VTTPAMRSRLRLTCQPEFSSESSLFFMPLM
jgi:hypothetical protein